MSLLYVPAVGLDPVPSALDRIYQIRPMPGCWVPIRIGTSLPVGSLDGRIRSAGRPESFGIWTALMSVVAITFNGANVQTAHIVLPDHSC
ncbi:hypothetical protein RISK_003067 [Rhodopirellula islandica]|uniref:Uncharacterized protein n=1 Tax=Rhodopirellula islandica TaxID=595434 RepID=A0A0J1EGX7_RHOIS|nr:hypothetical protein RISK_003067 [Rhodopirellula islandica]